MTPKSMSKRGLTPEGPCFGDSQGLGDARGAAPSPGRGRRAGPRSALGLGFGEVEPPTTPHLLGRETLTAASGLRVLSHHSPLCSLAESPGSPSASFPTGAGACAPAPASARASGSGQARSPPSPRRLAIPHASPAPGLWPRSARRGRRDWAQPTHIRLRPSSTKEKAKPEVGWHAEGHDFDSKSSAAFLCHPLQMTTTNLPGESELYDKKSTLFSLMC